MKLTSEDLDKLQTKQLANVIRKLNAGKTLTAREEAMLAQARAGEASAAAPAAGYVKTWDELAAALGVTRRAIQEWKKDPRYSADCPRNRADGRKEVAAWSRFMVQHNLKRASAHVSSEEVHFSDLDRERENEQGEIVHPPRLSGSQADWQKALIREKTEVAKLERLTVEGTLLVAADLEVPLGATFATIQTKLSQFPTRVARYIVGLRDAAEIEERLRDELDADLSDLQAARFTAESAIAEAIAALPFDAESERLFQLVTFDGQDRAALLQLVAAVASQALRSLGRSAPHDRPDRTTVAAETSGPADANATPAPAARVRTPLGAADPPDVERDGPKPLPSAAKKTASSGRKRKSRAKPTPIPPVVEGAIYREPRKRRRR